MDLPLGVPEEGARSTANLCYGCREAFAVVGKPGKRAGGKIKLREVRLKR